MASDSTHRLPLGQLLILSLCRLAEPIALTSVFPYLPEMIESFGVEKANVAKWAGITAASFSIAQAATSIPWGAASDVVGRKPTLLVGLSLTMVATLLFGFSRTLGMAIFARCLAGASSGTIGITRTAVAEMVPWKELQPRAFSFMPMVWSVGSITGPILGGFLSSPATKFPDAFGGSAFFREFPFSPPNMLTAVLFFFGSVLGILFLKETLASRRNNKDRGLIFGQLLIRPFGRQRERKTISDNEEATPHQSPRPEPIQPARPARVLDVFSVQTSLCMLAYTLIAFHSIAFDQLLPVFLHSQPQDPAERELPFKFAGGFGLGSGQIGFLLTCYAILGLFLQFCVFPPVARHFGVLRCLRITTFFAPVPYLLMPFTVLLPTPFLQRSAVFFAMSIKCVLSAFWFPCIIIALTNATPSPHLLGTLNGVATAISAIGRATGPASAGALFTYGVKRGYVIIPWFYLAFFAGFNYLSACYLVECDGLHQDSDDTKDLSDPEDDEDRPLLSRSSSHPLPRGYETNE